MTRKHKQTKPISIKDTRKGSGRTAQCLRELVAYSKVQGSDLSSHATSWVSKKQILLHELLAFNKASS